MTLKVLLPEKVLLSRAVRKVVAEGAGGSFGLLPRHVDFVEPLVPGILSFVEAGDLAVEGVAAEGMALEGRSAGATEIFMAVDEGVLVKCGSEVLVSVRNAVIGPELGTLEATVRDQFQRVDAFEGAMRTALAKLEAEVMRRFVDLE